MAIPAVLRLRLDHISNQILFVRVTRGSPRHTRQCWPGRKNAAHRVVFGHWSTLPVGCYGRCFALDGGCVWGGHMVALRIDYEAEDWVFVDSPMSKPTDSLA